MKNEKKLYEKPVLTQHQPLKKITKKDIPTPFGICGDWSYYPAGWPNPCGSGGPC